jgi:signal peptidase I
MTPEIHDGMEPAAARRVRPFLAFLAGFFGLGLGYVYVGRVRLGIATVAGVYGGLALFAWTRLVVLSAAIYWLVGVVLISLPVISLIHPIVIASRNRVSPRKGYSQWWFYVIWLIVTGGSGYAIVEGRAGLLGYETFRISSVSMSPTAELDDFVVADTWRYRKHPAMVGEIVIVERPENPGVSYIKRVVAVSGDSIEIRDGVLYRNGGAIAEPYVHAPVPYAGSPRNVSLSTLEPGLIYVLGDFRDNSMDSRQWGPFPTSSLRGRVQYIWFSIADGVVRWNRVGISLRQRADAG